MHAATYQVTITDTVSNCSELATVTVGQPDPINLSIDAISNVLCYGQSNGAVQVSGIGGMPSYTFDINAAGQVPNSSGQWTNLSGSYTVTVTDLNGCGSIDSFIITNPDTLTVELDTNNITCNGLVDGALNATIQGGVPSYTIVWNPLPSGVINGEDSIMSLPAGSYTITVQDSNGCIATATGLVLSPIIVSVTDNECIMC